jgi:hypothetical protein
MSEKVGQAEGTRRWAVGKLVELVAHKGTQDRCWGRKGVLSLGTGGQGTTPAISLPGQWISCCWDQRAGVGAKPQTPVLPPGTGSRGVFSICQSSRFNKPPMLFANCLVVVGGETSPGQDPLGSTGENSLNNQSSVGGTPNPRAPEFLGTGHDCEQANVCRVCSLH